MEETVWPPPPTVPEPEPAVDPDAAKTLVCARFLNKSIFLFVGGCLLPFFLAITEIFVRPSSLSFLRFLWPVLYAVSACFGVKAIQLAWQAQKATLQAQGFVITFLCALFAAVSVYMLTL